jgi:hypothetical protein
MNCFLEHSLLSISAFGEHIGQFEVKALWSASRAGLPNDRNLLNAIVRRLFRCIVSPQATVVFLT